MVQGTTILFKVGCQGVEILYNPFIMKKIFLILLGLLLISCGFNQESAFMKETRETHMRTCIGNDDVWKQFCECAWDYIRDNISEEEHLTYEKEATRIMKKHNSLEIVTDTMYDEMLAVEKLQNYWAVYNQTKIECEKLGIPAGIQADVRDSITK